MLSTCCSQALLANIQCSATIQGPKGNRGLRTLHSTTTRRRIAMAEKGAAHGRCRCVGQGRTQKVRRVAAVNVGGGNQQPGGEGPARLLLAHILFYVSEHHRMAPDRPYPNMNGKPDAPYLLRSVLRLCTKTVSPAQPIPPLNQRQRFVQFTRLHRASFPWLCTGVLLCTRPCRAQGAHQLLGCQHWMLAGAFAS